MIVLLLALLAYEIKELDPVQYRDKSWLSAERYKYIVMYNRISGKSIYLCLSVNLSIYIYLVSIYIYLVSIYPSPF